MRALSHSSISLYMDCPLKWKFKYLDKIPEKPRHFFSFGRSVHEALEYFYKVEKLPPPTLDEVLAYYEDHWVAEGYKDAAQERTYKEQGRRILSDFWHLHAPTFRVPLHVEYGFDIEVEGVAVTGKVDRIDKLDNGKLAIIDYKTGKAFDPERVRQDAQLTMYQMAVQEKLGMEVESLTFYHLPSQTPMVSEPHDPGQIDKLRRRIVGVAQSIQRGQFEPRPDESKCRWCDFKPMCPVFKPQYAPVAAAPAAQMDVFMQGEKSDDEALAELVDRFGRMKEQAHELEAALEGLKEQIVDLLKKKGYLRAFGATHEASLASDQRWEFPDKAAVLQVLKRHGLYDKVLKPSAPEVQKLLADPELPSAARKELEALGRKVEHGTLRCHRVSDA